MTKGELKDLKDSLSTRLDSHLIEMKEGYDDSITGFNEAWDIMLKFFDEKINPKEPTQ